MKRFSLLLLTLLITAPAMRASEVVPFIENDYAKAVATARTKQLPLFVEAWAPW